MLLPEPVNSLSLNLFEALEYLKSHKLETYSFNFLRVFDGEIKRKFFESKFLQDVNKKTNFEQSLKQQVRRTAFNFFDNSLKKNFFSDLRVRNLNRAGKDVAGRNQGKLVHEIRRIIESNLELLINTKTCSLLKIVPRLKTIQKLANGSIFLL